MEITLPEKFYTVVFIASGKHASAEVAPMGPRLLCVASKSVFTDVKEYFDEWKLVVLKTDFMHALKTPDKESVKYKSADDWGYHSIPFTAKPLKGCKVFKKPVQLKIRVQWEKEV